MNMAVTWIALVILRLAVWQINAEILPTHTQALDCGHYACLDKTGDVIQSGQFSNQHYMVVDTPMEVDEMSPTFHKRRKNITCAYTFCAPMGMSVFFTLPHCEMAASIECEKEFFSIPIKVAENVTARKKVCGPGVPFRNGSTVSGLQKLSVIFKTASKIYRTSRCRGLFMSYFANPSTERKVVDLGGGDAYEVGLNNHNIHEWLNMSKAVYNKFIDLVDKDESYRQNYGCPFCGIAKKLGSKVCLGIDCDDNIGFSQRTQKSSF